MRKFVNSVGKLLALALALAAASYPVATVFKAAGRLHDWLNAPQPVRPQLALNANVLTGLIPTLYEALNVVSREMVGMIPAVRRDSNAERAAVNQTVRVPLAESGALEDVTPGATPASSGDTTPAYADITITKSKAAPIRWNGEEQRAVGATGVYNRLLADQFADAMRKIVNAIEADLVACGKVSASRAYGTPGTAPFGTSGDLTDIAQMRKILEDNGAPLTDLQLCLGSAAWLNLRGKQAGLFRVNEAGSGQMLRDGMWDRLEGFALRNSAGVVLHTKGTGASYVKDAAGTLAVGSTSVPLITGTGTILAGDVITYAADTANKYVVGTGIAAPGTIVLNKPGILVAMPNGNAITVGNSYTPNLAFARTAIVLAARAPAVPQGGDMADDAMTITDPVSGLTFEVRVYRQYRQVKFEVCMAWGCSGVKGEHIAILQG